MRVWFIDDDPDNRHQFLESCVQPGRFLDAFESTYESCQSGSRPDVVVIDCSAVGTFSAYQSMYAPICAVIQQHPDARYVIRSAMPIECALGVVEDVLRELPHTRIRAADWAESFEDLLGAE